METTLITAGIIVVSSLASYGYYLVRIKKTDEFDKKRRNTTSYQANEEFMDSDSGKSLD
ncbi:MAG: hypothetical protein WD381_01555 [Balneolaceae bacterium]